MFDFKFTIIKKKKQVNHQCGFLAQYVEKVTIYTRDIVDKSKVIHIVWIFCG